MKLKNKSDLAERRKANLQKLCDDRFQKNQAELARVSGINANQINFALSDNEKINRPIGEHLARRIEENLSLPIGYLDRPEHAKDSVEIQAYTIIPEIEAVLATSSSIHGLSVTPTWIKSFHVTAPDKLLIAEIASDGMEPDIRPGEQVILEWLADQKGRPVKPEVGFKRDGVYIIDTKVGPMLRRVARTTDASYVITSPNKDIAAEKNPTLSGVKFYARVVTPLRFGL